MSSPATIPHTHTFINLSSPVEMTRPHYNLRPTHPTVEFVIIDSDTDDNGAYTLNNMNSNSRYGSQGYFGSNVTIPSTNTQSSPSIISLNSRNRTGSDRNGGGPTRSSSIRSSPIGTALSRASRSGSRRPTSNRASPSRSTRSQNSPERFSAILNFTFQSNLQVSYHHNGNSGNPSVRQHASAFLPYSFSEMYTAEETSSRRGPYESRNNSATTNLNSGDVQILSTPPTPRKNNNLSKDIPSHTRDIADNHTLICAECSGILQEKLWALGCGHVICGGCSTKFSGKKRIPCPSCQNKSKSSSMLQLYV